MTRGLVALAILLLASSGAWACPPPSAELLFHSCWGDARLTAALLPEERALAVLPALSRGVAATGVYTAKEPRADGLPKPVGVFVHRGQVINPNLGRMDGILLIDPVTGQPQLHHRRRVGLAGQSYDLTDLGRRRAFLSQAASSGVSVLQSHLLIVDGRVDVRPQEAAPVFARRILFTDDLGFGLFQTPASDTLRGAAERLAVKFAPRMALNLDMGSYDFCLAVDGGVETNCGFLGRGDTAKLSNLLLLSLR
jgi:hypothetical protein